jgi:Uma2 family endonuclease
MRPGGAEVRARHLVPASIAADNSPMFTVDTPPLSAAAMAERWLALAPLMPEEGRPEIDQYGELFVAPLPTNHHQRVVGWIGAQLLRALGGEIGSFAILTRIGVRVPDLCWTADAGPFAAADPSPKAPEICVEVASPGNSRKWLLEKAAAYLEAGAREVIIVEWGGQVRYFDAGGERAGSAFGVALTLPPR